MGLFEFFKKNKKNETKEIEENTAPSIKQNGKSLNEIYAEKQNIAEMFVNKENMSFEKLEIGMKLSGLFQLQGQIKE